jgi:hypothetical protein
MRGRYQLGEEIPLSVLCVDADGAPANPSVAPHMDIYRGATQVLAGKLLPQLDPGGATGLFGLRLFLGADFSEGRHTVVYRYLTGSYLGQQTEEFEVVAGGHRDGAVLAMHWYERPHARFVVQQLDSGKLVKGRNPRV